VSLYCNAKTSISFGSLIPSLQAHSLFITAAFTAYPLPHC